MSKLLNRSFGYSKIGEEDAEEASHRRAQFLIYKTLQRADSQRSRPSWLKVKTCKLKIKIGRRLKKLRKNIYSTISAAEVGVHNQIVSLLKAWKRLLRCREAAVTLQPVFS